MGLICKKVMQDLQMILWKICKEQNICVLMSLEQAHNGCLNYAFKWEALEDLKKSHILMKSVFPSKDINLIMRQRHQEGLTQRSIKGYIEKTTSKWSCIRVNIKMV